MHGLAKCSAILIGLTMLFANGPSAFAENGAKDLFYKQMSRPGEQLNTGVQYWIELRRNNESTRVNNKFEFKSGDKIKFHVKANISGFAYVILREGSKGEHEVLFPDRQSDDNRIKAGADYALPGDGYLLFDSVPGNEKLMLVLSRSPIRVDDYIKNSTQPRVLVASRQPGSKDLVPGSAVVSFDDNSQIADMPADSSTSTIAVKPPEKTTILVSSDTSPGTNPDIPLPAGMANSVTTVIEKDPQIVLALDIVLSHKP